MQSRVEQFTATAKLPREALRDVPLCRESWALWVVTGSTAFASRSIPVAVATSSGSASESGTAGGPAIAIAYSIQGFADMMANAVVSHDVAERLHQEMKSLGVIGAQELTSADWQALESWQHVLPFTRRRILALVQ